MKRLSCGLIVAVAVSGCDVPETASTEEYVIANGAVLVRRLEADSESRSADRLFEITVQQPGWLSAGLDRDSSSMAVPVSSVPAVFHLSADHQFLDADEVLRQFVEPLFGADAASPLRDLGSDAQLVLSTITLEAHDGSGVKASGTIGTRLSGPVFSSYRSTLPSLQETEESGSVETWVFVPSNRDIGIGIAEDEVHLSRNGERVTAEEVDAVIRYLIIGFGETPPRPPAEAAAVRADFR